MVKYRPETAPKTSTQSVKSLKPVDKSKPSILDGLVKVKIAKNTDPIDACNALLKDPNIIYAEPIVMDRPLYSPSDPFTSNQYYLDNIQAYDAWNVTRGDDDIAIGIIDTGIDLDHEDLVSNLWTNENDPIDGVDNDNNGYVDDYWGYDFSDDDNNPEADQSSHGVRVAGIAGATSDNATGMAGIGFNSKVAALKGFQTENGFSNGLFDAILYAADNGIQVLNLSWGSIREPLQSEQDIINYAVLERDVIIVAAAGNEGGKTTEQEKFYPANYDNVLAVGGSNESDEKWSGSTFNYGIDLIAPASSILSTISDNSYNSNGGFGTSFAAPMVAGAAALVKDQFPNLSAQQIMERVRATTDDVYGIGSNSTYEGKLGKGRLNVFRAVSETNVKSLRVENSNLISTFDSYFFFGDTVSVTTQLKNYLSLVNNPSVYISSPDNNFTIINDSFFPGFMNTLDDEDLSFQIVLNEDVAPDSDIAIRLDYADGSYSDFQHIEFTTSPDYADFGNGTINMTVEGSGNLGLVQYGNNEIGSGLIFQSDTLLKYTGIMFATGDDSVADNIISDFNSLNRQDDFQNRTNFRFYQHHGADHFGYSEFTDPIHNLIIEQSNLAWVNDDFFIIRYRVVNNNPDFISNLSFGVFTDWDLDEPLENFSEYDQVNDYLYTRNSNANLFTGTKVIGNGTTIYSALDIGNENGNTSDLVEDFSDSVKFEFLTNEFLIQAGSEGSGNNVAGIHGININQLDSYDEAYINVIYAVSDSKAGLDNVLASAETRITTFLQTPRIQETIFICDGTSFDLDPSNGTDFEFYEDALGTTLISSGSTLSTSNITSDTSIYVRNIDEAYKSDLFEVQIKLLSDIADFELSTDTLYLDNETTNIVQFTDLSKDAISWHWDFGQGSNSTIQNPILSFNQAGTYSITLTADNAQGCMDSITKTLVVAERPNDPVFDDFLVCPGTTITLSEPSATNLKVFARENQNSPVLVGASVEIGPFTKDSIVFVSAIIDGFETNKVPVSISVFEEVADFSILPDTTSESFQLIALAEFESTSNINWFMNGNASGSSSQLVFDALMDVTNIRLEVTTENGCIIEKEIDYSANSSPTPSAVDQTGCNGESLILTPENGNYFAFYDDAELTTLISKGSQLQVEETQTVYIVGLDDGLPGAAIEVSLTLEDFDLAIAYDATPIGDKNRVDLSANSNQTIAAYQWYVNDVLTEISSTPSLFFDNTINEIVLEATSIIGCVNYDTIQLDFTPPLGITESGSIKVHPNPTDGRITVSSSEIPQSLTVLNLSGKELITIESAQNQIDLSRLNPGIYLLEFRINEKIERLKVIKNE